MNEPVQSHTPRAGATGGGALRGVVTEQYLRALLSQASDAIISTDERGAVLTWNVAAAHLFGYSAEQAIGQPLGFLDPSIPPSLPGMPTLGQLAARVLQARRPEQRDATCVRRNQTSVDVAASVAPIRGPDGEILGLAIIARDVSERRRIEGALREANRQKDEFLATASHELRTPLTAIIGYTELLLRGIAGPLPPQTGQYLALVRSAGERLLELVNALLAYSRLEARAERVTLRPLNLHHVVHQAVDAAQPRAQAKRLSLRVAVPEHVPLVLADTDKLRHILRNYLSNAIEFTPAGGEVWVEVGLDQERPDMVRVAVRDTGIGIAQEQLARVWERFYQVDSSLTREHGGMGLGLAIVRHLADLHGACVGVESGALDAGSTFWISLPVAETHAADPAAQTKGAPE